MCPSSRDNSPDTGCSTAGGESGGGDGVRASGAGVVDQRVEAALVGLGKLASLAPIEAGLVHELNNQTAFVILAVSQLERGLRGWDELTEEKRDGLRKLTQDIGLAADHVRGRLADFRQLLTVMRRPLECFGGEGKVVGQAMEHGSIPVVDVSHVVQLVVELTRGMHHRGIEVHVQCEQMEPRDVGIWQVASVLGNVLTNAFESFELRDGKVGLGSGANGRARANGEVGDVGAREPGIWVTCEGNGEGTRLVVRDNGSGMGAEVCARVFEPLFTTRAGGHWGLGLTIARGIVRGIGGEMTVESELGRGTVVTVDLP